MSEPRPLAVLVGVQLPGVSDAEHAASMAELGRLVHTLGYETLAVVTQRRSRTATGTVVGDGKLKEIARYTGGSGVVKTFEAPKSKLKKAAEEAAALDPDLQSDEDFFASLPQRQKDAAADFDPEDEGFDPSKIAEPARKAEFVIFDDELTPTQLRNLESATDVEVLDRSGVIVEIFHRHAKTREARLQVEIARLRYLAPRLRFTRKSERSGGGIGAKGVGETAHELDKRRIRDRIAEINRMLEDVHASQDQRRARREDQAKVALVGYTNAGKSSLMRALTGSEVLVQDKLFATLDTTIRALHPESTPKVLVSDTVGFIKKLPHDLVASFRSTLDEAADASLLLFVVDASDPTFRSQLDVTHTVLAEIGVQDVPSRLVLNKIDRVDEQGRAALRQEFPDALQLAAVLPEDVKRLRGEILAFFERDMREEELSVPYDRGQVIGEIRRTLRVISERHDENGTILRVKGAEADLARLRAKL